MAVGCVKPRAFAFLTLLGGVLALAGCQTGPHPAAANDLPRELSRVVGAPYVIEPPDVLQIDALDLVPKPPFRIRPLDSLIIRVTGTLPGKPVDGTFPVDPDGTVSLGYDYGKVTVAGMTLDEAAAAIDKQLRLRLRAPVVTVALATSRAIQQVRGPHLVNQDGTVSLGVYGAVTVAGLTVPEAKAAIELQLSRLFANPEVAVAVIGYNSKVFYIIQDQGGTGYSMVRLPVTGSETVLDALTSIGGLNAPASTRHIYIARPAPDRRGCEQILPVDIAAIVKRGDPTTNYQIFPGDRLYVKAQTLVTLNNTFNTIFAPIERTFGVALLGVGAVQSLQSGSVGGFFGTPVVGF